mmetsp:Transcript_6134/g.17980  ORF Transcript_6134/g.17980 Transcript_6134/m.17980 type:complete len:341 (-) Transcript_6134:45-1067(-)
MFIQDKRGLCRGMTRRINVKEKRLAEERAKQEKLYKQQEERSVAIRAAKADIDRPPTRAPLISKLQASVGASDVKENGAYLRQGEKPRTPADANPDSLLVHQWRAIAPDDQLVYVGHPPPRFPRGPPYLHAAALPPHVEKIDRGVVSSELMRRDMDMQRRRVYVDEPIHGRGNLIHARDAPFVSYSPDYATDPRERRAVFGHREGQALYHVWPHPHPQRLASLQDYYYELDHELRRDELAYHSRRPVPVSLPPYPAAVEMCPPPELAHIRACEARDPRTVPHALVRRREPIPVGSGVYSGEMNVMRAPVTAGASGPPTRIPERRRVDDAMLLLRLNENSR